MESRNCPNCGAPVPEGRYKCEYCGSTFRDDTKILVLERTPANITTLQSRIEMPMQMFAAGDLEGLSKFAQHEMAMQMADALKGFMEIQTDQDPVNMTMVMRGRVRVLNPDYRFKTEEEGK